MFIVRFYCWKLIINFQLNKNGIDAMLPGLFALFSPVDLPALKAFPAVLMLGGMSLGMLIGEVLCLLDSGRMESCHFGFVCIYMVLMVLIWTAPLLVCTERFQWPVKLPAHFWLGGCKGR